VSPSPARRRRQELWRVLSAEPYNGLLKNRYAHIKPVDARSFYTISCGDKGIIGPDTPPTGVVFGDGSFLRLYEKWSSRTNTLLEYGYHYQIPHGLSIRYDMDPTAHSPAHPEHHIQTSAIGGDIRLPSGPVTCEAVLTMIFEQFLRP
jgi:hypothetical protein